MNDVIRIAFPGDEESLKEVWRQCFQADKQEISDYFSLLYRPENTVVGAVETRIASMANLLYPGQFLSGVAVPCSMIYAVGTLPPARGRNLASKEVCAAVFQGFGMGAPVSVLSPAGESLRTFYRDRAGFSDFFYQAVFSCDSTICFAKGHSLQALSPAEYGALREKFLAGRPHIAYNSTFLSYACTRMEHCGGGFFSFMSERQLICCAVGRQEDTLIFYEFLTFPGYEATAANAAVSLFSSKKYQFRTPVDRNHCFGLLECNGMAVSDGSLSLSRNPDALAWYGITLE